MTYWAYADNCRATRHSTPHNKDVGLLVLAYMNALAAGDTETVVAV